jgi:hypothetical protein
MLIPCYSNAKDQPFNQSLHTVAERKSSENQSACEETMDFVLNRSGRCTDRVDAVQALRFIEFH